MKILFSATHFGFLRNFQSTIRLLAERGHELHLLAERRDAIDGQKMADVLAGDHPSITFELLPSARHRLWYALATGVRAALDYWRYLDPRWNDSAKLRARAADQAPAFAIAAARTPVLRTRAGLAVLRRLFRAIERVMPPPGEVADVFRRINPDVLLVTPLLYFRSHQVDHVRCARQLGIKSVLGVGSWDHLTTKGLIHEVPDRVLVWNDAQKQEAVELHDVPAGRVCVTGAQAYDHWFAARPTLDLGAFCVRVGLGSPRPFLLYLCSSPFIAPHEVGFVRRWIRAVRDSNDPSLRAVGILVRPHPQNAAQWENVELASEFDGVSVWPRTGVNPIGGVARSDYFDSIYHCEGVVGVNTSAMIESGIIGRPVYSVIAEEFAATQEGTLHFQHLKRVGGGLLHLAADLDAHLAQLAALFANRDAARQGARQFVQAFIRPHGLDAPATPRVVEDIEGLAAAPCAAAAPSTGAQLLRLALLPAAVIATVVTMERVKLRAMVLHWTRPARLRVRAFVSLLIYTARFLKRLPRLALRLTRTTARRMVIGPVRWGINRGKTGLHALLV
ncbi:MAG: hypothetical protein ACREF4_16465, partial [Gammaproteobacteria bacterium]